MATGVQVVFDVADPDRQAEFWAAALGYVVQPPPPGYESWEQLLAEMGMPPEEWAKASAIVDPDKAGPRVFFQKVPEPKVVKNRLHLDLNISGGPSAPAELRRDRIDAEVQRLLTLGAHKLYELEEYGQYHVTMADPEGNEFCVQ